VCWASLVTWSPWKGIRYQQEEAAQEARATQEARSAGRSAPSAVLLRRSARCALRPVPVNLQLLISWRRSNEVQ